MAWVLLVVAGLLVVVWAGALRDIEHFTRPLPTAVFLGALAGSMVLLARATETIPLGTAYVVWVGIGAVGATLVGVLAHGDPATPARLLFLTLLVVGIVGVKVTAS
jgi:quaternary ammonium compound-resistance protein SugE